MNQPFAEVIAALEPSLQRLLSMLPANPANPPRQMAKPGVYLFSEVDRHLYVGRSSNMRGRIGRHCRLGATHRSAAFAFRLAREGTGRLKPTYRKEGSRSDLMLDPTFKAAFEAAKERIRGMQLRFVEEPDPMRQAILEVYVAVALQTPYNDFDNH
jgi:hypothetical protein